MTIPGASVRNAPFFMQFSLLFSFLHLFMENSMEKKGKKEGGKFFPRRTGAGANGQSRIRSRNSAWMVSDKAKGETLRLVPTLPPLT